MVVRRTRSFSQIDSQSCQASFSRLIISRLAYNLQWNLMDTMPWLCFSCTLPSHVDLKPCRATCIWSHSQTQYSLKQHPWHSHFQHQSISHSESNHIRYSHQTNTKPTDPTPTVSQSWLRNRRGYPHLCQLTPRFFFLVEMYIVTTERWSSTAS